MNVGRRVRFHDGMGGHALKYLRIITAAMLCVSSVAQAESFDETPLGATVPMWYEHSVGINDEESIAWTHLDGGVPKAKVWRNGTYVDLHAALPASLEAVRSYAEDIEVNGGVVGYASSNARETNRKAIYWRLSSGAWSPYELPVPAGTAPRQSAAYSIARAPGNGQKMTVGGYVREAVSMASLSQPVVWRGTPTLMEPTVLPVVPGGYGVVYGVADAGSGPGPGFHWACGAHGAGAGAYGMAACWNLDTAARRDIVLPDTGKVVASSVIRRVRRLWIHSFSQYVIIAAGTVTYSDGSSRGFLYRVAGEPTLPEVHWIDGLTPGGSSMVVDVAESYLPRSDGSTEFGMMALGMGATTTNLDYATLIKDAPNPGGVYHGIAQAFSFDHRMVGPVCDVRNETFDDTAEATLASDNNGESRVVWANGHLTYYKSVFGLERPKVLVRDTKVTIRPASSGVSAIEEFPRHFQGRVDGNNAVGLVRWSSAPGCASMAGNATVSCDNARATIGGGISVPIAAASGGVARTATVSGAAPDIVAYPYMQASLNAGNDLCDISEVYPSDEVAELNPQEEFNSETRQWENCDGMLSNGYETDVLRDYFHCGGCNNRIVDDAHWCTLDQCVGGTVDRSQLEAGSCFIDASCYSQNQPSPSTACKRCNANTSQVSWSNSPNGTACSDRQCYTGSACSGGACAGGSPTKDAFEPNDTLATRTSLWGPSGTSGRSFRDSDTWSNGAATTTRSGLTTFNGNGTDVDWYHFEIEDCFDRWGSTKCGRGSDYYGTSDVGAQPRARVRVKPPVGHSLEVCMWVRCAVGNGISYTSNGSSASQGMWEASENVGGHSFGRCFSTNTNGADDYMRLYYDCRPGTNYNETADVYVRVRDPRAVSPLTCQEPYTLQWGNDKS